MGKEKDNLVLIVEDDDDLRKLYHTKLSGSGFNVETASDGLEGYEKIKALKPKVVLLDLILPKMNGFDVLEKIKEDKTFKCESSIIVISALGQDSDVILAKDLGAMDYLIKSNIRLEDIVEKVNGYLKKK